MCLSELMGANTEGPAKDAHRPHWLGQKMYVTANKHCWPSTVSGWPNKPNAAAA